MKRAFILACFIIILGTWFPYVSPQWWIETLWVKFNKNKL